MNLALAVERLIPDAQYRDASTYGRLAATWFDQRAIPDENDLLQVMQDITAERVAEAAAKAEASAKMNSAKTGAAKVPGWATMTEQEALDWINTNVTDLASAKQVISAMARMLVHLRDATWPDLT